jgi:hypothetical protein
VLEWSQPLAWLVGFAARNNALLRWSGQLNQDSISKQIDDSDFEVGNDSNGEKFDVIIPNPNVPGLDDVLDINFIQRNGLRKVSLNKEGFWKFLESLGFQAGKESEQSVSLIRTQIPSEFLADFDSGAAS